LFEDFVDELLYYCGKWLEPKSVLVMDNASFHHTERIRQLCVAAGVKLVYLPPYSPDLNPIKKFFAELKGLSDATGATLKKIPIEDLALFSNGVLIRLVQKKQVLEAIFGTRG
jgi:transposase